MRGSFCYIVLRHFKLTFTPEWVIELRRAEPWTHQEVEARLHGVTSCNSKRQIYLFRLN